MKKSNIPKSTVARVFSGKTPNPTVTTVISMARAMGSSVADLWKEEACETAKESAAILAESAATTDNREAAESAETLSGSDEKSAIASTPCHSASPARNTQPSEDITPQEEKLYESLLNVYQEEMRKKDVWLKR